MLLKDKLKKFFEKKNTSDKLKIPLMDGYVEIKGYDENGKLFYYDSGDNVVTDWMRQAIITLLTGVAYSALGNKPTFSAGRRSAPNPDGYCFNGKQYEEEIREADQQKYSSSLVGYQYAVFPTKVLFGTGKEYTDWATLKSENESSNAEWYNEMINVYGGGSESLAQQTFDSNINKDGFLNDFSGTITNGVFSGDGEIAKCRTVNDPSISTSEVASAVSMYRNYGVIGAIKTPYTSEYSDYNNMLQTTVSESGKLLKPSYRGVGKPAFIYFNQHESTANSENWGSNGAEVMLSKDTDNKYLTKITFTITLPEQSAATSAAGKFYPYNGYTLKQIGLYNDSQVVIKPGADGQPNSSDGAYYTWNNMKYGTLLAVKNIAPFTKSAGSNYVITWTLSI